jgi:hypothetical protein
MAVYSNSGPKASPPFTLTALSRWSIANKELPALDKIKALHVYDFDNTSKLPLGFLVAMVGAVNLRDLLFWDNSTNSNTLFSVQ